MKRLISPPHYKKYIWQYADWPNFTWDMAKLAMPLTRTRYAQGAFIGTLKTLGFADATVAQADILTEEAIKTSAVEGEILDIHMVRSSVAKKLDISFSGKMKSNQHIDGLIEVLLDATQNHHKKLSLIRLRAWHAALFPTGFSGMHKIITGNFRGKSPMQIVSGAMGQERVHFEAPPYQNLQQELANFIKWWNHGSIKIEGLIRAGLAHLYFVTIHPFEDGNGRIARALTDMALAQDEQMNQRFYGMSSQIMAEQGTYYKILEQTQKSNLNVTPWLIWFLECMERSIKKSEQIAANTLFKADYWRKHREKIISDRQRKVINKLLDAGIHGFSGGLTNKKYVAMAKVSRATAYREILDLVEKKMIVQATGLGRNVSYKILV